MTPCHQLPFETLADAAERGFLRPTDAWHLTRCDGCREAVRSLRRQAQALRLLAAPRGDTPLRERILDRARRRARERVVELLRALLTVTSASTAGGPASTVTELLREVAALDRRLGQLGGSPVPGRRCGLRALGELSCARLPAPDLARRTASVLEQLEAAWPLSGAAAATGDHQPAATPSLRDSLAPR